MDILGWKISTRKHMWIFCRCPQAFPQIDVAMLDYTFLFLFFYSLERKYSYNFRWGIQVETVRLERGRGLGV